MLLKLLFEDINLPTNKLIKLSSSDLPELEESITSLIHKAYEHVGGHGGFKSLSDYNIIYVADTDGDNKPNLALLGLQTRNGTNKFSVFATDSSQGAKGMLLSSVKEILSMPNHWAELPHQFAKFLQSRGANIINSEDEVRLLLGRRIGSEFKWHGNGYYSRSYYGTEDKRAIFGNIGEDIFDRIRLFNER